jgi:hypothetical protein
VLALPADFKSIDTQKEPQSAILPADFCKKSYFFTLVC